MIIDRPESWYIFIFSSKYFDDDSDDPAPFIAYQGKRLTNREYLEHWGKWVFLCDKKEEADEMARKLDPYVEEGVIPCIKYDRAPQRWADLDQYVVCVYCDYRERDKVVQILSQFGVKVKAFSYDREVIEKWQPGGLYLERWLTASGVTEEEAEKVREDARQKFRERYFERPDDLCIGIDQ